MAIIGKSIYTEFVSRGPGGASPTESLGWERSTAVRQLDVPWGGRQQAAIDLLGQTSTPTKGAGRFISRFPLPHAYPAYVWGDPLMWAVQVGVQGYGVPVDRNMKGPGEWFIDSDIAKYAKARLTVQYMDTPWDVISDDAMVQQGLKDANGNPDESSWARFVIVEFSPTGQMITMPKGTMKFVGGASPGVITTDPAIALAPPKMIPYWNVRVRHVRLPNTAVATCFINPNLTGPGAMDKALGKVNNADFPATGPYAGKFKAGTLLYVAAIIQAFRSPVTGRRTYDVTHNFQYAHHSQSVTPNGQNFVPYLSAPAVFGWVELSTDGTTNTGTKTDGKSIYDWVDFAEIFRAP